MLLNLKNKNTKPAQNKIGIIKAQIFFDFSFNLNFEKEEDKRKIIHILFSKKLIGGFWEQIENIDIEPEKIQDLILKAKIDSNLDIIDCFFEYFLTKNNVERIGAKYPVFISDTNKLIRWHPDSKIVHLIRDPRAIYCSKRKDPFSKKIKEKYNFFSPLLDVITLLRLSFEYWLSYRIHKKYSAKEWYYLLRYEDVLRNPELELKNLCNFLEINFEKKMLYADGMPSSHTETIKKGFDKNRAYAWKYDIKKWEYKIINLLTAKSRKIFGYID